MSNIDYWRDQFSSHAKWQADDGASRKGFRKAPRCDVLLYGEKVDGFVAVDTATGKGWRHNKDSLGKYVIDRKNECVVVEVVYGSFRIAPAKDHACSQ